MNSLRDELKYLFSGQGMPYEKVALMVAVAVTVLFTVMFGNNIIKDAPVAVIDLDNSKYSHEVIDKINATQYMKVTAVINTPVDPQTLFYEDKNVAVIYFPQNLEKIRYAADARSIGVFYDNTNTAQTSNIKSALNELVALENQSASGGHSSGTSGSMTLNTRNLFNPAGSTANGQTMGFLFFFSSMFFTFATIGMIPRLRLSKKLDDALENGTPFDILIRLVPYCGCLLTAFFVGLAILRVWGDLVFTGHVVTFLFVQIFYIFALGMMCLLAGWTAANPGVAASRMILFIPGGFIFGGPTGPVPILSDWVQVISHIFPLTWEYHFTRDIISRGAGLMDISTEFGAFLIYVGIIATIFCVVFFKAKENMHRKKAAIEELSKHTLVEG